MSKDHNFATGAVRSADVAHLSWTSLPMIGLIGLARTAGEGAAKYGRFNYLQGMSIHECLEHSFTHMAMYNAGDRSEPHLFHAAWGLLVAGQTEILDPELSAPHMLGPGMTITPAMQAHLDENAPILAARRKSGEAAHFGNWLIGGVPEVVRILSQRAAMQAIPPAPTPAPLLSDSFHKKVERELTERFAAEGVTIEEIAKPYDEMVGVGLPCVNCEPAMVCESLGCMYDQVPGVAALLD